MLRFCTTRLKIAPSGWGISSVDFLILKSACGSCPGQLPGSVVEKQKSTQEKKFGQLILILTHTRRRRSAPPTHIIVPKSKLCRLHGRLRGTNTRAHVLHLRRFRPQAAIKPKVFTCFTWRKAITRSSAFIRCPVTGKTAGRPDPQRKGGATVLRRRKPRRAARRRAAMGRACDFYGPTRPGL